MWGIITAKDAADMSYIHERSDWPQLIWNGDALTSLLATVRHNRGAYWAKWKALALSFGKRPAWRC